MNGFVKGFFTAVAIALLCGATYAFGQLSLADGTPAAPAIKFESGGGIYRFGYDGGVSLVGDGTTVVTVGRGGIDISDDTVGNQPGLCLGGSTSDVSGCLFGLMEAGALLTLLGTPGVPTTTMLAAYSPSFGFNGYGRLVIGGSEIDLVSTGGSSGTWRFMSFGTTGGMIVENNGVIFQAPNAQSCVLDGNATNPKCTVSLAFGVNRVDTTMHPFTCSCTVRGTTSLATHQTCSLSAVGAGPTFNVTAYGSVASSTRTVDILCL